MKRSLINVLVFSTLSAVSIFGCTEKTEVTVEDKKPDTVVVPDQNKDVNVNVTTENAAPPAPVTTEKETTTSTTIDNNGQTTTSETKVETSN